MQKVTTNESTETSYKPIEALCEAAMRLDSIYSTIAKKHGQTYLSMFVIDELGMNTKGLTQKELAAALYAPKQTVNSIIASLKNRDLIKTTESPIDKRSKIHVLTNKGQKIFDELKTQQKDCESACIQYIGEKRLMRMIADMQETLDCIEKAFAKTANNQT